MRIRKLNVRDLEKQKPALGPLSRAVQGGKAEGFIFESCGNVFLDMGFPPEEAAMLHLRCELAIEVEKFVRRNNLTQSAAAERLGVSQPRINDLLRHKIDLFRVDSLLAMLWRAGLRVEIRVHD